MSHGESLIELLVASARCCPHATALCDGERLPLTYCGLVELVGETQVALAAAGLGRANRVAIVLPNGPELAAAFLAVAGTATAAPLNPAYRQTEFEFYLTDLAARALIVEVGAEGPAVAAALAVGVEVLDLAADDRVAGRFRLVPRATATPLRDAGPESDRRAELAASDAALVLHTSGTTSRPKIVPLTQENLCHSARNIASSLALSPSDRCLNVMPLFHIHGLVGALLSTLASGGSVYCGRGFDAATFLDDVRRIAPTWYTAAPTIHQAVLAAAVQADFRPAGILRFVRSCSSPLPPSVMERLEALFGAPVLEAYGMTEAAHQMSCNPLPPGRRLPGSVGLATGVAIAIMNEGGRLLPPEQTGEVVISGPNVTAGYEARPEANAACFTRGWFRTGDSGRLDSAGYLFLTGRIKEIINRGGEKLSPREIDEVLLTHPAVAQAVAFAMPHPTLGEDVAAAVVLQPGQRLCAEDLQAHASRTLASFKVPRRVVFLPEIPKGPTGKVQRIGLAERLGLTGPDPALTTPEDMPQGDTEQRLATIWSELLEKSIASRRAKFFEEGGDSLRATMLLALIEKRFHVSVPPTTLFQDDSLANLAAAINSSPRAGTLPEQQYEFLTPFQTEGAGRPLFLVHGHSGRSLGLGQITPHLDRDQPYWGFLARGMDGRRLPHRRIFELAADYCRELRREQPDGPYCLGGFCAGGMIAYEMAQQLLAEGQRIDLLALIDTAHPSLYEPAPRATQVFRDVKLWLRRGLFRLLEAVRGRATVKLGERIVNETLRTAAATYLPRPYPGRLTLIRSEQHHRTGLRELGWSGTAAEIDIREVPGSHAFILTSKQIGPAARALQQCMHEVATRQTALSPTGSEGGRSSE